MLVEAKWMRLRALFPDAASQSHGKAEPAFRRAQQHQVAVRRDRPATSIGSHGIRPSACMTQTLIRHPSYCAYLRDRYKSRRVRKEKAEFPVYPSTQPPQSRHSSTVSKLNCPAHYFDSCFVREERYFYEDIQYNCKGSTT